MSIIRPSTQSRVCIEAKVLCQRPGVDGDKYHYAIDVVTEFD